MDAGTAAGAVAEILDRAGWDADYGPVLTEASEEDIARNVRDPADVPWLLSQNVLLPIPGLQGGYAMGQESLDLINDIHSDVHGDPPPSESGAPSDSDDQYTLNGYRLGQYFFPEEQDPDDLYLAGIRAFFLAIDAYESVYGILAPWHPVLPHDPDRAGIITFLTQHATSNVSSWTTESAPVFWTMEHQTFLANYRPDLQQWWLRTGLRELLIDARLDDDLAYSASTLSRFSVNGTRARAMWTMGRRGIEDADPQDFVRSILVGSLGRLARRLDSEPAPV